MKKIDGALISKLEKLSRLKLSDKERLQIESDLSLIVDMFDTLQEIETTGIEPLRHMCETSNVLREDVIHDELTNSQALKNVSQTHDSFIAVPKFLKPK